MELLTRFLLALFKEAQDVNSHFRAATQTAGRLDYRGLIGNNVILRQPGTRK